MRIFVINLDRSPDRMLHMQKTFDDLGICFERLSAIDGNSLTSAQCDEVNPSKRMSKGEIACFLSHKKCWELIAAGDDDFGVVFEDDVHISPRLNDWLTILTWLPGGRSVIRFETFIHRRVWLSKRSELGVKGLYRLHSEHPGTAGYVISKKAASFYLDKSRAIDVAVDKFMFDPKVGVSLGVDVYQISPALCIQDQCFDRGLLDIDKKSLIDDDRLDFKNFLKINDRINYLGKIEREVYRIMRQLQSLCRNLVWRIFYGRVLRRVDFDADDD